MSEIKFACPHCRQHIACDQGYCGYQIQCPACQGGLIVPRLAAFGVVSTAGLSLAVPVGTPVPRQAAAAVLSRPADPAAPGRPADPPVWGEQEWRRHVAETERGDTARTLAQLLLLIAPALLLGLVAILTRGRARGDWLWGAWWIFAILCSAYCALNLARTTSENVVARVLTGFVLTISIFAMNALVALFVGCIAMAGG